VAQQCERPACAEPAVVAYGFDPSRAVAWLEPYVAGSAEAGAHQGRLCRRHADAMVVPQGWWLEDRRSAEQLFTAKPAPQERAARRPARPTRVMSDVVPLPLPAAEPAAPPVDDAVAEKSARGDDTPPTPAWTPMFVVDDDLDGLLNATSPLLSRAFGRVKGSGTRQRAPGA
jgi:hypothetical protein